MNVKAEVFFLIVKLLEDEGCAEAARVLKRFIDEKKILPPRMNTLGIPFDNNFKNYDDIHVPIQPSLLVDYYQILMNLIHDRNKCSSYAGTLLGLRSKVCKIDSRKPLAIDRSSKDYQKSRRDLIISIHSRIRCSQHLLAHRTAIYCVEFDKRGEFILTGSDDYTIKIWSINSVDHEFAFSLRHTLRGHVAEIIELAVSMNNHLLASIDSNCCMVVWCLRTGQPLVSTRAARHNRILSGLIFLNSCNVYNNTSASATINNIADKDCVSGMLGITSFGGYLHLIPYVHTIFDHTSSCSFMNNADRWSCCRVRLLPTIRFTTSPETISDVFRPSITCMDISPGGFLIAAGCSDQRIRLYQFLNPLKPEVAGVLIGHEEGVNSVAFSHHGLKLATGSSDGGSCWLWKFQAGQWRFMALQFRKRVKCRPCLLVWSIHDKYLMASMKNGSVYIYFGHSGQLATVIEAHEGAIHALSPSPLDENLFVTGGVDARFQLWNIANLRRFQQSDSLENHNSRSRAVTDKPLLFHYRFPVSELNLVGGLVWRFSNPNDNQPIWPGPNNVRRITRDNQSNPHSLMRITAADQAPVLRPYPVNLSNDISGRLSSTGISDNHRTVFSSNIKSQRITACCALPITQGIGFVTITRSGLMSLFRPVDEQSSTTIINSDVDLVDVDEQFLHWELDTAEWKETGVDSEDPIRQRIKEEVSIALGSPPALQIRTHDNAHLSARTDSNHSASESNVAGAPAHVESVNAAINLPTYKTPTSVLFEVIHAPSGAPFHRLPPAYLTNFRGFPHSTRRQVQIPGRNNLSGASDLWPSVILDEETGEDIVVDDLQFCRTVVPSDYCPTPSAINLAPVRDKTYLWCSYWLLDQNSIIQPLNESELNSKLMEQRRLFESEARFFTCGGEALISFGDECAINNAKRSLHEQAIIMQPVRSTSQAPSAFDKTGQVMNQSAIECTQTTSCNLRTITSSTNSMPHNTQPSSSQASTTGNSRKLPPDVNDTNIRSHGPRSNENNQSVILLRPNVFEDPDDPEVDDYSESEESEWSENIDVDIGWWSRQRRRRGRRNPANNNEISHVDSLNAVSANLLTAAETANELRDGGDNDDENDADAENYPLECESHHRLRSNDRFSSFDETGAASLSSNPADCAAGGSRSVDRTVQRRRSLRQRNRLLAKRRLQRKMRLAETRAARLEIEMRRATARRSSRFSLATCENSRQDEDSTSRDASLPDCNASTSTDHTLTNSSGESKVSPSSDVPSKGELLKRRLIISMDYALSICNHLPLFRIPSDGYFGPDENHSTCSQVHSCIPNLTVNSWLGPRFDWLSTVDPIATPILPQLGDRLVYLPEGHKEYLNKAWQTGKVPVVNYATNRPSPPRTNSDRATIPSRLDMSQLPWDVWPGIASYLCCEVARIEYNIVRVSVAQCNNSYPERQTHIRTNKLKYDQYKTFSTRRSSRLRQFYVESQPIAPDMSDTHSNGSKCTTTTTNSTNSIPPSIITGDSFVRLVTLQLRIDPVQPYFKSQTEDKNTPHSVQVTYHDVDGVLDFLILRHVFDAAVKQIWMPGDIFICPVDDVWLRGRVLYPIVSSCNESCPSSSSSTSLPSLCTTITNPISYAVHWLDELNSTDTSDGIDVQSQQLPNLITKNTGVQIPDSGDGNRVIENVEKLSVWDMYHWSADCVDSLSTNGSSGFTFHGGLCDGYVRVPPDQLRTIFGNVKMWKSTDLATTSEEDAEINDEQAILTSSMYNLSRMIQCLVTLMQLDVSELFVQPIDLAAYPDYLFINPYPVDLGFILHRLCTGYYRHLAAVKSDFNSLLENTLNYNLPESEIANNARIVHQLLFHCLNEKVQCLDVMQKYRQLISEAPLPDNCDNNKSIVVGDADRRSNNKAQSSGPVSSSHWENGLATPKSSEHPQAINCSTLCHPTSISLWCQPAMNLLKHFLSSTKKLSQPISSTTFRLPSTNNSACSIISSGSGSNSPPRTISLSVIMSRLKQSESFVNRHLQKLIATPHARVNGAGRHYHCPHEFVSELKMILDYATTCELVDSASLLHTWLNEHMLPCLENCGFKFDHILVDDTVGYGKRIKSEDETMRMRTRFNRFDRVCDTSNQLLVTQCVYRTRSSYSGIGGRNSSPDRENRTPNVSSSSFVRTSSGRLVKPPSRGYDNAFVSLPIVEESDESLVNEEVRQHQHHQEQNLLPPPPPNLRKRRNYSSRSKGSVSHDHSYEHSDHWLKPTRRKRCNNRPQTSVDDSVVRRSARNRKAGNRFGLYCVDFDSDNGGPDNFGSAETDED